MTVELVIAPASAEVAAGLGDAAGWSAYEQALRAVLAELLDSVGIGAGAGAEAGAGTLTVDSLIINEPLPERFARLRPGATIDVPEALDLAVGMVIGDGPYLTIQAPGGFELASGWDGAVHVLLPARPAELQLPHAEQDPVLRLEWRDPPSVDPEDTKLITAVADEAFWAEVEAAASAAAPQPTLLAERWAYGALGLRWFLVTPGTTQAQELARTVEPGSLLSVVVAPELDPSPEALEDGFEEATVGDLSLLIPDEALAKWRAVVPDADGVVRARWEDETA
ncbi:hypothetical protein [Catenulispora acidiphila]|uniref:hypothetical protein n=1 Tax=Catenulispora acidiphila TaxID=304895 RepID=UPI0002DC964E|nr:hypothetical protein [Catenulispora acidiphila]